MERYLFIFVVTWLLHHLFNLVLAEPINRYVQIALFVIALLALTVFPQMVPV